MKLFIKNMVCGRCLKVIRQELESLGIKVISLELGTLEVDDKCIKEDILSKIQKVMHANDFEIIYNSDEIVVEDVKHLLFKKLEDLPLDSTINLSEFLSSELNHEYKHLSKLFSSCEKITIEKYFIRLKIEKVKELIQLNKYTFSEIGYLLDYNNVNHLSKQFKEIVGVTMTEYKNDDDSERSNYDEIV